MFIDAWPEHLFWDGYSGDYGPNFVGLTLGSGTYLSDDQDVGLSAFGGILELVNDVATVTTRDPVRQKVFIGPLGIEIRIDAGIIESFTYNLNTKAVSLTLAQLQDGPEVNATVVWISRGSTTAGIDSSSPYSVTMEGAKLGVERQGTKVPFSTQGAHVRITLT